MCEISKGSVQWKELHNSDRRRYRNKRPVVDEEKGDRLRLDGQERRVFRTFSQQGEVLRDAYAKSQRKLISRKSCTNATVEDTK